MFAVDNKGANTDLFGEEKIIMDYSKLVQTYCSDLTYLAEILGKLTGTYNLLIISADGFNKNSFAKKDDVEDAIDRAHDLGKIIDKVIKALEIQVHLYTNYLTTKDEFISVNFPFEDIIVSEVENSIKRIEKEKK